MIDHYLLRKRWDEGAYGRISDYIDFESLLTLTSRTFDSMEVWNAVEHQFNHRTSEAFFLTVQSGIDQFIQDLRETPLSDFLRKDVLGFDLKAFHGTYSFYETIDYE